MCGKWIACFIGFWGSVFVFLVEIHPYMTGFCTFCVKLLFL